MTKATKENLEKLGELNPFSETVSNIKRKFNRYNVYKNTDQAMELDPDLTNQNKHDVTNYLYQLELQDNPNTDYFEFYKEFNPNGPLASQKNYVEAFSKFDPNLQTMDDFEIAKHAYNTINVPFKALTPQGDEILIPRVSNIKYRDFFDNFASKSVERDNVAFSPTEFLDDPIDINPDYSTKEIAIRNDISADAYEGAAEVAFAKSLGDLDTDKLQAASNVLSATFGPEVKPFYEENTGEYVFINPKTGKKQLLNPPSTGLEDIAGMGGDALVMVPDAIGATMGLILGSTPASAIASGTTIGALEGGLPGATTGALGSFGASLFGPGFSSMVGAGIGSGYGSAFGDAARIYLGNELYGVNKGYDGFVDVLKKKGKFDSLNAAVTAGGLTMEKTFNLIKGVVKGHKIDPDIVKDIKNNKLNAAQTKQLLDEMNETLGLANIKEKLHFSLGEIMNNPKMLRKQKRYEDNDKYGLQGRFDTFNKERADALKAYVELNAKNLGIDDFIGANPQHKENIGRMIQKVIQKRLEPRRKVAIDAMQNAERNLTNQTVNLASGDTKAKGVEISGIIKDIYKTQSKDFANEYATLFNLGGNRTIKLAKDGPVVKEYQRLKNLLEANDIPKTQIDELVKNPLRKLKVVDAEGKKIKLEAGERRLEDIKQTITSLMRKDGDYFGVPGYPEKLEKAYRQEFSDQLGADDPWLQDYIKLSKKYETFRNKFAGTLSDVVKIGDGSVKIGDEDVFKQVFKKGSQNMDRTNVDLTYDVLKSRPDAISTMRDAVESKYRREVIDPETGVPNPNKHKAFMDSEDGYGYAVKKFFGDRDFARINALGDLTKVNKTTKEKAERVLKNIEKSTKGQLASARPSQVYDYLFDKNNPNQARSIMNILKNEPEAVQQIKEKVHARIYREILDDRGNITPQSFKNLKKFLDTSDEGYGQTLRAIFNDDAGKQYIKNLKKVEQATDLMTRSRVVRGTEGLQEAANIPQYAVDMARGLLFRPLSREGKMFTGALKYLGIAMDEAMADILTQPKLLDAYLKAADKPIRSKAFRNAMGLSLGVPFKIDYETVPEGEEFDVIQETFPVPKEDDIQPQSQVDSPTVDMFAMQPPATQPASRPEAPTPPPAQQGIAAMQPNRAQQYAGLFPNDPSGQMIAQGKQNA